METWRNEQWKTAADLEWKNVQGPVAWFEKRQGADAMSRSLMKKYEGKSVAAWSGRGSDGRWYASVEGPKSLHKEIEALMRKNKNVLEVTYSTAPPKTAAGSQNRSG